MAKRAIVLVLVGSLLPGCSLFKSSQQQVTITASDPAAEILVDGSPVGIGTARVGLQRNETHAVMARAGNRVGTSFIGKTVSTTGILDIIGGCFFLVPFFGLIGPGFWDLDPRNVTVILPQD